jgi:hypothetical protein
MMWKSFGVLGMVVTCLPVLGQSLYKTSVPEKQKVVEELVYYYEVSSYTPAVPVDLTKTANPITPEGAAMQLLEAMHSQDFDRWLRLWTPESQQIMKSQYQKNGTSPDVFKNGWSKAFNGRTATLTKKIETGPYVIVVATLSPTGSAAGATPAQPIDMEFVFKQVNGVWMATQELAADAVLNNWKQPNSVTRRVVRSK